MRIGETAGINNEGDLVSLTHNGRDYNIQKLRFYRGSNGEIYFESDMEFGLMRDYDIVVPVFREMKDKIIRRRIEGD